MKSPMFFMAFLMLVNLMTAQANIAKFQAHQNLIGGIWELDANWADGTPHQLKISYEAALNGTILKTKTYGNVDSQDKGFDLRNEGIRYLDKENNTIGFLEFDVFGTLTKGKVDYKGKNIYYTYEYNDGKKKSIITDGWEYVNDHTYNYSIGVYDFKAEKWLQVFLKASIKRSDK